MIYENEKLRIVFDNTSGGFPTRITLKNEARDLLLVDAKEPFLQFKVNDKQTVRPFLSGDFECQQYSTDAGCDCLQFDMVKFKDQNDQIIDDMYLSTRYDIYADGHVFAKSYFVIYRGINIPGVKDFIFKVDLNLEQFEQKMHPGIHGAKKIKDSFYFDDIRKSFCFSCKQKNGFGSYLQLFMENDRNLINTTDNTSTLMRLDKNSATCKWNFQTESTESLRDDYTPVEWRSQWGWLFTNPPVKRRLPPLRVYHFIDYWEQPSKSLLSELASSGVDAIVIHEQWRLDARANSFPYDRKSLQSFIAEAHKQRIRIILYCRGVDELATEDDLCDWFSLYLKKDFDGIYFDSGVPMYSCEKVNFKRHYLKMRRLRKVVGDYGVIICHGGSHSDAVATTENLVDARITGEAEDELNKNRFHHEAGSYCYAALPSLWSAAKPKYTNQQLIPFLAASGQYVHCPIGNLSSSSSLLHPNTIGIGDVYLRPLWKLHGTFAQQRDIDVYNQFNSVNVLSGNENCGAYLMLDEHSKLGLLILSSFAKTKKSLNCKINWSKIGFSPENIQSCYALQPDLKTPGIAKKYVPDVDFSMFSVPDVDEYGCVGFLFGQDNELQPLLSEYATPYPETTEKAKLYQKKVEKQRKLRNGTKEPQDNLFLRVTVPEPVPTLTCAGFFYKTFHQLGLLENGEFKLLGYLTASGFKKDIDFAEREIILPERKGPWVDLTSIIGNHGRFTVAIRSISKELDLHHSMIKAELSPKAEICDETYAVEFLNQLEDDWSQLHFSVNIRHHQTQKREEK